jgi:hypothetical protein
MDEEQFIPLLRQALDEVNQKYYRHHLWRNIEWVRVIEELEDTEEKRRLKDYLERYGERVFCYELYYKVRSLMEEHYPGYAARLGDEDAVLFQAELKKSQIGDIVQHFPEAIENLDKAYIPDFLLHTPGSFRHQELIIEVKSNPSIDISKIIKDLVKIDQFIERYRYRKGILLVINKDPEWLFQQLISVGGVETNNWYELNLPNRDKIMIMCKHNQEAEIIEWYLTEF